MYSRWYSISVVLLWLSTMGWLVSQKVMPSMVVGDPPDYQAILEIQRDFPPIGWQMFWGERKKLGWAVTSTLPVANGLTEVRSYVCFSNLPLHEIVPDWLQDMVRPLPLGAREHAVGMEACSTLTFDPLWRLSHFQSSIRFHRGAEAIRVRGRIEGSLLQLSIRCGELPPYDTEMPAPRNTMVNDGLSPQGYLPGLRKGQRWTVEAYGPLRPPNSPREILHAEVEDRMPLDWNGHMRDTWLVVYRSDPGSALGSAGTPCGKLWVNTRDGMVLQQQVTVFRSTLKFVRTSNEEANRLAQKADEDW